MFERFSYKICRGFIDRIQFPLVLILGVLFVYACLPYVKAILHRSDDMSKLTITGVDINTAVAIPKMTEEQKRKHVEDSLRMSKMFIRGELSGFAPE